MYAVIFRAKIGELDEQYQQTATELRTLAFEKYACLSFESFTENEREITISYWQSLDDIARWKQDAKHLVAQVKGQECWYHSYHVQVVEVLREYSSD